VLPTALSPRAGENAAELRKVALGTGVELNYTESGRGVPLIFVHGTLGDYSTWASSPVYVGRQYLNFSTGNN